MINHIDNIIPKFKTTPFKHQLDDYMSSRDSVWYAILWEMGLGKSKLLLDTASWLYSQGKIDGLLIIAPKGSYLSWVYDQVPDHLSDDIDYRIGYWSSSLKKNEEREAMEVLSPSTDALDIACVNIEALSHKRGALYCAKFVTTHRTLMCIDESTGIKSHKALRTKTALKLGKFAKYRRIMTGTPVTQSPLDLYSQCQFLEHGCLGFTSFFAFKNFYADIIQLRLGTRTFPKIVGFRNLEDLSQKLSKFSTRRLKSECLDLPDKLYETRYIEMTAAQQTMYETMRDLCVVQLESSIVTVTSVLTAIIKLQEILCGHIKDENGTYHDVPTNRLDALLSVVEEAQGSFIVWCNFVRDVEQVSAALTEAGISNAMYYGKTSDEDRVSAIKNFQGGTIRGFVGTAACGGVGNTLTAASTVIYYSNGYNLQTRLQSEDRAHRIGQTKKVTYVDLIIPGTIDEKIVKALKHKKNVADQVLDNWRTLLA